MFTTGSKWFFGLGLGAFVLAAVYGYGTGGDLLGPLSLGWWGAVGDHLGYGILLAAAVVSIMLGVVALASRDADAEAVAQYLGQDAPPPVAPPARPSFWPIGGAFGLALVAIGLVIEQALVIAGLVVTGAALVEWAVLAWSDRATGDPATNTALRDQLMRPLEVPIAGAAFVGLFIFGLSRVFLTLTEEGAVVVAAVAAVVVLGFGALVAIRPRLPSGLVAGVVALAAVGVVSAGVVAVAQGERHFEEHHGEEDFPEQRPLITPGVGIGEDPSPRAVTHADQPPIQGTAGDPTGEEADTPAQSGDVQMEGENG
jgi:hypothetical protein